MIYDMLRPKIEIVEKDTGYAKLKEALLQLTGGFVKVGFPEGKAPGSPGDPGKARKKGKPKKPWDNMSEVARIAAWNEFGVPAKNIPSRPYFRNAIDGSREELKEFKKDIFEQVTQGKINPHQAFELIGLWMQNKIRESILKGSWKPNAERTKREKGSSKPLIDSGQMINSLTFVNSLSKEK
jgi:hypothetical protein